MDGSRTGKAPFNLLVRFPGPEPGRQGVECIILVNDSTKRAYTRFCESHISLTPDGHLLTRRIRLPIRAPRVVKEWSECGFGIAARYGELFLLFCPEL